MKKYIAFICVAILLGVGFSILQGIIVPKDELAVEKDDGKTEFSFEMPNEIDEDVLFPFDFVDFEDGFFVVEAQISDEVENSEIIQFAYNLAQDLIKLNQDLISMSDIKIKLVSKVFFPSLDIEEGLSIIIDFSSLTLKR